MPAFSKSRKRRIRKYHSLDAKGNLKGRNSLWFFVFVHSSIHLCTQLFKTCSHFGIIHPSIHLTRLHQIIFLSIYHLSLSLCPSINLSIIHPTIQSIQIFMHSSSIHPAINHLSTHPTAQLFTSPIVHYLARMIEDLQVWLR